MFKGFSVDIKGQRQRLKFQERQRLQQQFVNDSRKSSHFVNWDSDKSRVNKFAARLIK